MKGKVNLSIQELDAIAQDGSVKVPEGFGESLRTGLDALDFISGTPAARPQWLRYAAAVAASVGAPLAVELEPLRNFYAADEYHQDYLVKNPGGYCHLSPALFELARNARESRDS